MANAANSGDSKEALPGAQSTLGPASVFISYASQDASIANAVVSALEHQGLNCWLAPRNVKPGTVYADAIVGAINESRSLVLVLSANAMASAHVGREIERAASKRKQLIAFRIDTTPLSRELEYFLSNSQWIDVSAVGMPTALAKLVGTFGQVPATSARKKTVTHLGGRMAKRVTVVAAIVVCASAAAVLGGHFWAMNHTVLPAIASPVPDKSIAVLPFADMSEKKDQEYFADGMAEEVLDLLVKIPGLNVIGRTSSFQFKGKSEDLRTIGTRLGAAFVVEGSVRRAGPRIRVTAQLIDASSGAHRWSQSYDRDFGDVLALQDEIATSIARALQLSVDAGQAVGQRKLPSAEGYALYLRGLLAQDEQSVSSLNEAVRDFEQALTLDPSFLRAAEALARAYLEEGFDEAVSSRVAWQSARDAAKRTLHIDSNSATAHAVLGLVQAEDEFDWNAAEAEFSRAFALNPRDPAALCYAAIIAGARGKKDESERLFAASLAVDPLNPYTQQKLGQMLVAAGDFAGAQVALRKSIAINASFDGNHFQLMQIEFARGDIEAALREARLEAAPDAKDAGLAMAYHALHRKGESDAALARLIHMAGDTWPYSIAAVYAYRGERNEAFNWLEKGLTSRDSDQLEGIRGDPEFAPLRADRRYKALLRQMNLPE